MAFKQGRIFIVPHLAVALGLGLSSLVHRTAPPFSRIARPGKGTDGLWTYFNQGHHMAIRLLVKCNKGHHMAIRLLVKVYL